VGPKKKTIVGLLVFNIFGSDQKLFGQVGSGISVSDNVPDLPFWTKMSKICANFSSKWSTSSLIRVHTYFF
jgi:hypothetical protein